MDGSVIMIMALDLNCRACICLLRDLTTNVVHTELFLSGSHVRIPKAKAAVGVNGHDDEEKRTFLLWDSVYTGVQPYNQTTGKKSASNGTLILVFMNDQ